MAVECLIVLGVQLDGPLETGFVHTLLCGGGSAIVKCASVDGRVSVLVVFHEVVP